MERALKSLSTTLRPKLPPKKTILRSGARPIMSRMSKRMLAMRMTKISTILT